jgi:hypothetical protein
MDLRQVLSLSGAESGALGADLREVVAAWSRLPEAVRTNILALVRASIRPG